MYIRVQVLFRPCHTVVRPLPQALPHCHRERFFHHCRSDQLLDSTLHWTMREIRVTFNIRSGFFNSFVSVCPYGLLIYYVYHSLGKWPLVRESAVTAVEEERQNMESQMGRQHLRTPHKYRNSEVFGIV